MPPPLFLSRENSGSRLTEMAWPAALSFVYPPPQSAFATAMTISTVFLAIGGVSEVRGTHMKYSKFWTANSPATEARGLEPDRHARAVYSGVPRRGRVLLDVSRRRWPPLPPPPVRSYPPLLQEVP